MRTIEELNLGCAHMLRKLREKRGLTKTQIAAELYMPEKKWARWEAGKQAPAAPELLWVCSRLGESVLLPMLEWVYPERYSGLDEDVGIDKLREAAAHYFTHVASERTVRQWSFILFGDHGSDGMLQTEEMCAIDHLPMAYRYTLVMQMLAAWDLTVAEGKLVNTDHIMPDIDALREAARLGLRTVEEGRQGYTTVLR